MDLIKLDSHLPLKAYSKEALNGIRKTALYFDSCDREALLEHGI